MENLGSFEANLAYKKLRRRERYEGCVKSYLLLICILHVTRRQLTPPTVRLPHFS